ncbi:GspH/FimT family pseudopilin [Thiocystis violacea]|uniref:GspH/FimT family pseudopilin n=1 Tax=Thiocystis violacea TaxID=13725 RepID=UPI00190587D4|nr:GspH/FimT family pseudopilin [Thiocystis violacea]MBK1723738.1 hypothetical protein [Thiocystis violacea]
MSSARSIRECRNKARRGALIGFTLIELLVTISVLAILVALAAPGFENIMTNNRVTGATNELSAALNLARSEAIKRGRTVTVCKSSDTAAAVTATTPACDTDTAATWPDGWLIFVDQGTQGTRDGANDDLIRVGQPSTRNLIQTGSDFAEFISFFPNGSSSASGVLANATLTLCMTPAQRQIVISRTGQIQIIRGTCP